jgi:hypothetical protein
MPKHLRDGVQEAMQMAGALRDHDSSILTQERVLTTSSEPNKFGKTFVGLMSVSSDLSANSSSISDSKELGQDRSNRNINNASSLIFSSASNSTTTSGSQFDSGVKCSPISLNNTFVNQTPLLRDSPSSVTVGNTAGPNADIRSIDEFFHEQKHSGSNDLGIDHRSLLRQPHHQKQQQQENQLHQQPNYHESDVNASNIICEQMLHSPQYSSSGVHFFDHFFHLNKLAPHGHAHGRLNFVATRPGHFTLSNVFLMDKNSNRFFYPTEPIVLICQE